MWSKYKKKAILFKKLIRKNYTDLEVELFLDEFSGKYTYVIKYSKITFSMCLQKDIEWEEFNKVLSRKISFLNKDNCEVCYNKFAEYANVWCSYCSKKVCNNCFINIERNNGIFKCPFCRKYALRNNSEIIANYIKQLMDENNVKYNIENRIQVLTPLWNKCINTFS